MTVPPDLALRLAQAVLRDHAEAYWCACTTPITLEAQENQANRVVEQAAKSVQPILDELLKPADTPTP